MVNGFLLRRRTAAASSFRTAMLLAVSKAFKSDSIILVRVANMDTSPVSVYRLAPDVNHGVAGQERTFAPEGRKLMLRGREVLLLR